MFNSAIDCFGLASSFASIAEAAQINVTEQPARLRVFRIALQQSLGFQFGVVNALRFPVHFRETLSNDRRLWIKSVSFLVVLDCLGGVFAAAGRLILLLRDVAHRVVEIGIGAAAVSRYGRFGALEFLLLWGRRWRRSGSLCKR